MRAFTAILAFIAVLLLLHPPTPVTQPSTPTPVPATQQAVQPQVIHIIVNQSALPTPQPTPRPTRTPRPTATVEPTEMPTPEQSGGLDWGWHVGRDGVQWGIWIGGK